MSDKKNYENWADSFNSIVTNYFNNNMPSYVIKSRASHGPHWGVRYLKEDIKIYIEGDIGFTIKVFIDNVEFDLWQYDRTVFNATVTNKQNIIFQLEILKRFLR